MFTRTVFISLLLLASAGAQTINPNQIRPGTNGQVLTTAAGITAWGGSSFTLGSTNIQLGGTYTTVTGLTINGVSLTASGSSSLFLNQAGTYTAPTVSAPTFNLIGSGTNTTAAMLCGTGCTLQPSGSGTITPNAINLAASGNGGVTGNLPVRNLNGGVGASGTTAWFGDGTWKTVTPGGVTGINGTAGAFTFTGTGQSCVGTTCTFGGGGSSGISGGTAGHVPLFGSATTITANSHIDEVTTPGTTTVTQPLTVNDGTGHAASIGFVAGTAPSGAPSNTVQVNAPTSVTAYGLNLPGTQPTAGNTRLSCTAANPSVCTWASDAGSGFPITVGSTSIAASSTTTNVAGLTINSTTIPTSATLPVLIASGTSALGTGAISSATCATVVTTTATGVASTDAIIWNPNASIKGVTGYIPATTGGLTIAGYPTTNAVNWDVCNWSASSITPGAVTLNWRVLR